LSNNILKSVATYVC